jgi:hypothetical protein
MLPGCPCPLPKTSSMLVGAVVRVGRWCKPQRPAGRRRWHSITVSAADAQTTHRRDAAGNVVTRSRVPRARGDCGRYHRCRGSRRRTRGLPGRRTCHDRAMPGHRAARTRDYTDVAPTSGTHIGTARSTLTATKQIDVALPSPTNSPPTPGTRSLSLLRWSSAPGAWSRCAASSVSPRTADSGLVVHARPALRCAEVGDLCTATCFYRLSADTNMRSRVAWGAFRK